MLSVAQRLSALPRGFSVRQALAASRECLVGNFFFLAPMFQAVLMLELGQLVHQAHSIVQNLIATLVLLDTSITERPLSLQPSPKVALHPRPLTFQHVL